MLRKYVNYALAKSRVEKAKCYVPCSCNGCLRRCFAILMNYVLLHIFCAKHKSNLQHGQSLRFSGSSLDYRQHNNTTCTSTRHQHQHQSRILFTHTITEHFPVEREFFAVHTSVHSKTNACVCADKVFACTHTHTQHALPNASNM